MTRQYSPAQLTVLVNRIADRIQSSAFIEADIKPMKIAELRAEVDAAKTIEDKLAVIDEWSAWFA